MLLLDEIEFLEFDGNTSALHKAIQTDNSFLIVNHKREKKTLFSLFIDILIDLLLSPF